MAKRPTRRFLPLLWGAVALLSAANLAAWFWQRERGYQAELAKSLHEAEIANDAFVEETEQMLRQIDTVLRALRAFYLHSGNLAETERFINELKLAGARIENAYLVDAAGRLVITHDPATFGRSVADRDYFRFHLTHSADLPFISAVELGRATRKYLFRVTRRIDDARGRFAGLALVTVTPGALSEFYQRLSHQSGSVASLIGTRDRRLRARTPTPAPAAWQRPIDSPLWQALRAAPTGRYLAHGAIDGVLRHFVYREIPSYELVMLSGFADQALRDRAAAALRPTSAFMLSANLVLLGLAALLSTLHRQRRQLDSLANTDALTGLANRRRMVETGTRELARAQRYAHPFALLLLDVDHFKKVNDRHGHASGDRVLQALARCGQALLRGTDLFGRLGGEEFLLLLPETDPPGALALAERLRLALEQCRQGLDDAGQPIPFSVSIGVVSRGNTAEDLDALLARADAALYRAKAGGRNRVEPG